MKQVIAYYRVSTQRQGQSGLGLEGQRTAVAAFCAASGSKVAGAYEDIESGRRNERQGLKAAIAHARRLKCTLLIAKLDRLARNVSFIANIMESDVEFTACDLPSANRLLLHVMAAVAEAECKQISDRTKVALAAAKVRGQLLGASNPRSRNLSNEAMELGRELGTRAIVKRARDYYTDIVPRIKELRGNGSSLAEIANALTLSGHTLRSGKAWNSVQVKRILDRQY